MRKNIFSRPGLLAVIFVFLNPNVQSLRAQPPARIQQALDAVYERYRGLQEGKNADYIPALAKVDSKIFGIALVTTDGRVYTAGDVKSEVSIQSISKVFTLAKVIEEQSPEVIENTIGVDATGMRFNSIIAVEAAQKELGGPEMNSLVNPGAIATTSMVNGATRGQIWNSLLSFYSDFAGHSLSVNQEVFKSESDTNQRNQAIGYLMYAYGYIKANPMQATDIYTEQCSVSANVKDLATMAASLARWRQEPAYGQAGDEARECIQSAGRDGHRGPLRRLGEMAVPSRSSCQERRRRRDHRCLAWEIRDRRHLAAAGLRRQQCSRAEGNCGHFERSRRQPVLSQVALMRFG
jgi:glutaminase